MKSSIKKTFMLLASLLLVFNTFAEGEATATNSNTGGNKSIRKIIFDNIHRFDKKFDENVTEYNAIAYERTNKFKIYSFLEEEGYTVSYQLENGEWIQLNARNTNNIRNKRQLHSNEEINLKEGNNILKIKYSKDGVDDKIYTFNINKVNYDFRGRTQIDKNNIKVKKEGDSEYQEFSNFSEKTLEIGKPLTFDLGEVKDLSRIEATVNKYNQGGKVEIEISEDGENWKKVIEKGHVYIVNADTEPKNGTLQEGQMGINGWHKPFIRYEFGEYLEDGETNSTNAKFGVKGRYIRYKLITNTPNNTPNNPLKLTSFDIYETTAENKDKNPTIPELNEVNKNKNLSEPYQITGDYGDINDGQKIVIERGMPTLSWTPSATYGRGFMTEKELEIIGFNGAMFYDAPIENDRYMVYNPNSFWSITKAPGGNNSVSGAGEPHEFINEKMLPYVNNLVDITFGDESHYSEKESKAVGKWIEWAKQKYPGVLMHTNENSSWVGGNNETIQNINAGLQRYRAHVRDGKVDALTFDRYHTELHHSDGNRHHIVQKLLKKNAWYVQRQVALEGNHFVNGVGDGTKPIVFGQYLDVFVKDLQMTAKNIMVDLSLLSGMKWLAYFRTEYDFDKSWLFDRDGTPTSGAEEIGKLVKRIELWSPYFTRLNNEFIAIESTDGTPVEDIYDNFRLGGFRNANLSLSKNREFNIKDILLGENKGYVYETWSRDKPGDIALGYFKKVPGLKNEQARKYFYSSNPKAFMVLNGSIDGTASTYNYFNAYGKYNGMEEIDTREITLKFYNGDIELYRINDEGVVEKVNYKVIKKDDNSSEGELTLLLPGGRAGFFFWGLDLSKLIGKHEYEDNKVLVVRRNESGKLVTEIRQRTKDDIFKEETDPNKKRLKANLIKKLGDALIAKENENPDSDGIEPNQLGDDFEVALDTLGTITNKDGTSTDFEFSNIGFINIRKISDDNLEKNRELIRRASIESNKNVRLIINGDTRYKKNPNYSSFENKLNLGAEGKFEYKKYKAILGVDGEYKLENINYNGIKSTVNVPFINIYHRSEIYDAYAQIIAGYKRLNHNFEANDREISVKNDDVINVYAELGYNFKANDYIKLPLEIKANPYLGYSHSIINSSKYSEKQSNLEIVYKKSKYEIPKLILGTNLNLEYKYLFADFNLEYRYLLSNSTKLKTDTTFGGVEMYVEEKEETKKHIFISDINLGVKINDKFNIKLNGSVDTNRQLKGGLTLNYEF